MLVICSWQLAYSVVLIRTDMDLSDHAWLSRASSWQFALSSLPNHLTVDISDLTSRVQISSRAILRTIV